MKTLTEAFNKATVAKGENFKIELEGNATTGYTWEFTVVSGKASFVKGDYVVDPTPEGEFWCGVGGKQSGVFKAEEKGEIEIRADHLRPWDRKSPPAESKTFKITVK